MKVNRSINFHLSTGKEQKKAAPAKFGKWPNLRDPEEVQKFFLSQVQVLDFM